MSLEHELKRALRAEDPGEAFTARVLARVQADKATRVDAGAGVAVNAAASGNGIAHQSHSSATPAQSPVLAVTGRQGDTKPGEPFAPFDGREAREEREDAAQPAASPDLEDTRGPQPLRSPLPWPGARPRTHAPLPDVTAPRRTRARWVWVATMAASLLVSAAGGAQWMKHRHEVAEGERARAEVLTALRLTSAKLSLVRSVVASSEETH